MLFLSTNQGKVVVIGEKGICFSANQRAGDKQNSTEFQYHLGKKESKSFTVKVRTAWKVGRFRENEEEKIEAQMEIWE